MAPGGVAGAHHVAGGARPGADAARERAAGLLLQLAHGPEHGLRRAALLLLPHLQRLVAGGVQRVRGRHDAGRVVEPLRGGRGVRRGRGASRLGRLDPLDPCCVGCGGRGALHCRHPAVPAQPRGAAVRGPARRIGTQDPAVHLRHDAALRLRGREHWRVLWRQARPAARAVHFHVPRRAQRARGPGGGPRHQGRPERPTDGAVGRAHEHPTAHHGCAGLHVRRDVHTPPPRGAGFRGWRDAVGGGVRAAAGGPGEVLAPRHGGVVRGGVRTHVERAALAALSREAPTFVL
mmetsp:Transcript_17124/g.58128  ORF Transcript_17124/g.58128 Transcript_17124/m.58128 type:complete len:291 (-) Transcript_17124:7-879(-)